MKKSIWIVLPIIIIAVVLVAVFAGQRNSLSDQIAQLESDKAALSKQLTETDAAAKKAIEDNTNAMNELVQQAETRAQEAESKVEAAESKVQEVAEQLNTVTTERDTLQTNAATAAEQLTTGIKQAQTALEALIGPTEDELSQTKAALAEMTEKNEQTMMQLQQSQEALAIVTGERDELRVSLENAAAEIAELKVGKAGAVITDAEGNVVKEYADISELVLEDVKPGYTISIVVYNEAGEVIVQYKVPFAPLTAAPAEEAPAEAPAAEEAAPAAEEAPAEAPAEGTEEAPAEAPAA